MEEIQVPIRNRANHLVVAFTTLLHTLDIYTTLKTHLPYNHGRRAT